MDDREKSTKLSFKKGNFTYMSNKTQLKIDLFYLKTNSHSKEQDKSSDIEQQDQWTLVWRLAPLNIDVIFCLDYH